MSDINFKDMVRALAKDGQELINGLTPMSAHLLHMAVGVDGEIGEFIENYLENGSRENKVEELGDIENYFEGLIGHLDLDENYAIGSVNLIKGNIEKMLLELSKSGSCLLDVIKKHSVYEEELDKDEVVNQLANIRKSLTMLYTIYGISRGEAIEANIAKLGERYSSGTYSNNQAQSRADKK